MKACLYSVDEKLKISPITIDDLNKVCDFHNPDYFKKDNMHTGTIVMFGDNTFGMFVDHDDHVKCDKFGYDASQYFLCYTDFMDTIMYTKFSSYDNNLTFNSLKETKQKEMYICRIYLNSISKEIYEKNDFLINFKNYMNEFTKKEGCLYFYR